MILLSNHHKEGFVLGYVGFGDCGYEYFNEENHPLFSENNAHEILFHYVVQDLSCLSELFDQYISQRMDTSTFKLHDRPDDNTFIDQMKKVLMDAHLYYKHEVKDVLIRAVGNYFNDLLLYSCYHQGVAIPNFSQAWYTERVAALLDPLLKLGDTYPQDFYNEYQDRTGMNTYTAGESSDEVEIAIYGVPREMPTGFSNEIRTQREISNMLYFLLDISASGLDVLATPQRIWLYSNIMTDGRAGITVPKRLCLKHPTLYRNGNDHSQFAEYNCELDDKFHPLYALRKMNVGRNGVPAGMEADIRAAIDYAKEVATTELYETYEISSLYQLLYLEVWSMVQDKVKIRKCRRCGKYFVVPNRKTAYCNRTDESGVCCSVVGSRQSFQKKMEKDGPLRIYTRAYKTHHARVMKRTMSKDAFRIWCDEARLRLERARAGKLDITQFQEWLKK